MNGGNMTRGQADGYGLEILSKLKDVKSTDPQVTLLHFIIKTYLKDFDSSTIETVQYPIPDADKIRKAASTNFDEVAADLEKLKRNLQCAYNYFSINQN